MAPSSGCSTMNRCSSSPAPCFSEPSSSRSACRPALDDRELHTEMSAASSRPTHLSRVDQINRFGVLPVDWLPDSDELTPTLKLKRRVILENAARRSTRSTHNRTSAAHAAACRRIRRGAASNRGGSCDREAPVSAGSSRTVAAGLERVGRRCLARRGPQHRGAGRPKRRRMVDPGRAISVLRSGGGPALYLDRSTAVRNEQSVPAVAGEAIIDGDGEAVFVGLSDARPYGGQHRHRVS